MEKKNCSTIFLLPGIGFNRQELLPLGFISAFVDDLDCDIHYEDSVYLLFKPEKVSEFKRFVEDEHKRSVLLIGEYDYEGGYTVLVYKFNEKYMEEYKLFLQGKYSKFSQEYVGLFASDIWVQDEDGLDMLKKSLQYHIFTRSDAIRKYWEKKIGEKLPEDMELWSAPDMNKEILDITLYKNS